MSRETEEPLTVRSSLPAGKSPDNSSRRALFIKLAERAIGPDLVGTVDHFDGNRLGFATLEPDRGAGVIGRYVEPIITASREAGLHSGVMPFPVNGKLVYEVAIRRPVAN